MIVREISILYQGISSEKEKLIYKDTSRMETIIVVKVFLTGFIRLLCNVS